MPALVPSQILWSPTRNPALGGMSATADLNDLAAGDTTTWEAGGGTHGAATAPYEAQGDLTVVADFGSAVAIGDIVLASYWNGNGTGGGGPAGGESSTSVIGSLEVAYSSDGTNWTVAAVLGDPNFVWGGAVWEYEGTDQGYLGVTARYVRLTAQVVTTCWVNSLPITADVRFSDLRFTQGGGGGGPDDIACGSLSATPGTDGSGNPRITLTIN